MKKIYLSIISIISIFLFTSCYSLNYTEQPEYVAVDTYKETEAYLITGLSEVQRELSEFIMPEHETIQSISWISIEWTDDELTDLLNKAEHIYTHYFKYLHCFEQPEDLSPDGYYKTGISYSSFKIELQKYFTNDFTDYLLSGKDEYLTAYTDYDGELCYIDKSSGSNPFFDNVSFSIMKQTDNKIIIKAVSRFWHDDEPNVESFRDFYYTVILTENGWRFDNFEDFRNNLIWDANGNIIPLETHIVEDR